MVVLSLETRLTAYPGVRGVWCAWGLHISMHACACANLCVRRKGEIWGCSSYVQTIHQISLHPRTPKPFAKAPRNPPPSRTPKILKSVECTAITQTVALKFKSFAKGHCDPTHAPNFVNSVNSVGLCCYLLSLPGQKTARSPVCR